MRTFKGWSEYFHEKVTLLNVKYLETIFVKYLPFVKNNGNNQNER